MIESERVAVSIANDRAPDEERVGKGSQIPDEGTAYFDREGLELTIDLVLNADEHARHFLGQLFVTFRPSAKRRCARPRSRCAKHAGPLGL